MQSIYNLLLALQFSLYLEHLHYVRMLRFVVQTFEILNHET